VHPLAQRVFSHIRRQELLKAGDRLGVAVSGGIDSIALLRLLLELRGELGIVLSVVHFNHKLRGAESDADEQFVAGLAREPDLEFHFDSGDVAGHARAEGVSVEAAARELRYGFFRYLLGENEAKSPCLATEERCGAPQQDGESENLYLNIKIPTLSQRTREGWGTRARAVLRLDKLATGHTLDDQAETVLMRMIRGAGPRGLGGIYPRIPVEDDDGDICGEIVRPLLGIRRCELEQYLKHIGQPWREDSTNFDATLTRNRVRQLVVPLLEKEFNPAVAENLAELAEIARGEEDYWENEVAGWMGTTVHWSEPEWAREGTSASSLIQIGAPAAIEKVVQTKSEPQGLKPPRSATSNGTASAVPFPGVPLSGSAGRRGPEGPFFHALSTVRGSGQERLLVHEAAPLCDSQTGESDKTKRPSPANSALRSRIAAAPWLVMNASVNRLWLLGEPVAVQRRLIKAIGEQARIPLEFRHIEEILRFAAEDGGSGKELSLPLGWKVRREPNELVFLTPDPREPAALQDYEYELPLPGAIVVKETGLQIQVQRIPGDAAAAYNPDQLLDAQSVPGPLRVRNWRSGDRFWPAHTKSPKKIKDLLQERHVAQPERRLWPVVVSGDEVVWVRGFPSPAKLQARPGRQAIRIVDTPSAEKPRA